MEELNFVYGHEWERNFFEDLPSTCEEAGISKLGTVLLAKLFWKHKLDLQDPEDGASWDFDKIDAESGALHERVKAEAEKEGMSSEDTSKLDDVFDILTKKKEAFKEKVGPLKHWRRDARGQGQMKGWIVWDIYFARAFRSRFIRKKTTRRCKVQMLFDVPFFLLITKSS